MDDVETVELYFVGPLQETNCNSAELVPAKHAAKTTTTAPNRYMPFAVHFVPILVCEINKYYKLATFILSVCKSLGEESSCTIIIYLICSNGQDQRVQWLTKVRC